MTGSLDAYAVILAGGSGTRFWPASTPTHPKQFLPLASDTPLLVETVERAEALVGQDRIRIVSGAVLADSTRRALPDLTEGQFLFEPRARGTGPALTWASHELLRQDEGAILISMHADHRIEPFDAFREATALAVETARSGRLCCLGVRPSRAEPGYGYVHLGRGMASRVYRVDAFVEKPNAQTAEAYVRSGEYLWNTGIFVWRAVDFLAAVVQHSPEMAVGLPDLENGDVPAFFEGVETISVDVSVMERAERIATVEAEFDWDDVGVWNAVARTRGQDASGNTAVGLARFGQSSDNIVWTDSLRATLLGVSGLVVVEANGELLVTTRELAPRLNELRAALKQEEG
jgi:mannose-1-phosphate guanylyltransferase